MLFLGGRISSARLGPTLGRRGEDFARESVESLRERLIRLAIVDITVGRIEFPNEFARPAALETETR